MTEFGSKVAQRPDGQVGQQSKISQSNQPDPNPDHDRTVKPVVCRHASHAQGAGKTSRCHEIETRSFHEEAVKHDRTVQPIVGRNTSHEPSQQSRGMFNVLSNVDRVPSNVQFSHHEALLYVFEDNEAVIKMIIKGRSPTMRHVSRTHRVALDWLFDRINLDPKIQIKYIDTKTPLADMLTKGNFERTPSRDEWNHLFDDVCSTLGLWSILVFHFSCALQKVL